MHFSFLSSALLAASVSGAVVPTSFAKAPALDLEEFKKFAATPMPLEALKSYSRPNGTDDGESMHMRKRATCNSPRVRVEWDNYSTGDRQNFVNSIKCLMGKPPSGTFSQAKSRYEDLVALHQTLTPNVHNNAKFVIWHRQFLWTFEDIMRTECGFTAPLPWFNEENYAGRFSQSSIFSDQWLGGIGIGGNCVTNGQFANLVINVGPGSGNTRHCLARNGDPNLTANCNSNTVAACKAKTNYNDFAGCTEGGLHAWGHNGIGAVMQDVYASPADPVFWLHHGKVDRDFRLWQNVDSGRTQTISGTDHSGALLTMDTNINVYGFRPDVKVRDVMSTLSDHLCYKYDY